MLNFPALSVVAVRSKAADRIANFHDCIRHHGPGRIDHRASNGSRTSARLRVRLKTQSQKENCYE